MSLHRRSPTNSSSSPRSKQLRTCCVRAVQAPFGSQWPQWALPQAFQSHFTRKSGPPMQREHSSPSLHVHSPASDLGWRLSFNDHYQKGKSIGSGSFGQVYLGIQRQSGIEVAVKTLPKVRGKLTKEKTLEKISRETDMLQRLQSCTGVIKLIECYEDESSVHLVTELCPGGDLQKYVEANGPLDEASLATVALEVLLIVNHCHQQGILHGDVKPANFCLKEVKKCCSSSSIPHLKAIDFGCSQFLGSDPNRRLSKRTGTPVFMSPEIFQRDYSHKADVWSVGVMLYWLFSQRFPFFPNSEVVKAARLEEVSDAVTNTPIRYDQGPWPAMSPEGLDFIKNCLSRDEDKRMTVEQALSHPWVARRAQSQQQQAVSAAAA